MLCISRKPTERVRIRVGAVDVWVTLMKLEGHRAFLGIDAPRSVEIMREEIIDRRAPAAGGSDGGESERPG